MNCSWGRLALLLPLALLTLGACSTFSKTSGSKVELIDRDGIDLIAAPAGHVSVIVKGSDSKERTCGGRLPDAIMDSSVGLTLPGKGLGVGSNNTDVALGGRSPAVLIVRELLYRLCEIGLNADLPAKDLVELYKDTLPLVDSALKASSTGTATTAIAGTNPGANFNVTTGNASNSLNSSTTNYPTSNLPGQLGVPTDPNAAVPNGGPVSPTDPNSQQPGNSTPDGAPGAGPAGPSPSPSSGASNGVVPSSQSSSAPPQGSSSSSSNPPNQ